MSRSSCRPSPSVHPPQTTSRDACPSPDATLALVAPWLTDAGGVGLGMLRSSSQQHRRKWWPSWPDHFNLDTVQAANFACAEHKSASNLAGDHTLHFSSCCGQHQADPADGGSHPHPPNVSTAADAELGEVFPHLAIAFAQSTTASTQCSTSSSPTISTHGKGLGLQHVHGAPRGVQVADQNHSIMPTEPAASAHDATTSAIGVAYDAVVYANMFPDLTLEVVSSVLRQYVDNSQTALDQLVMLSRVVSSQQSQPRVDGPDCDSWGWDGASSNSRSRDNSLFVDTEVAVEPAQVHCESDPTDAEKLVYLEAKSPRRQAAPADQAYHYAALARPTSCETDLTEAEKLDYLEAEFPCTNQAQRQTALDSCNGNLSDALELLRSFAEEDAQARKPCVAAENGTGSVDNCGWHSLSDAAAKPAPLQIQPQLSYLAASFPGLTDENVRMALECAEFELPDAQQVSQEQGYTTVAFAAADRAMAEEDLPLRRTLLPVAGGKSEAWRYKEKPSCRHVTRVPIEEVTAGMPPDKAEALRNQIIYDEERAPVERLKLAYMQLLAQAELAQERGDRQLASDTTLHAATLRDRYELAKAQCATRIRRRVNQGKRSFSQVDFHGMHVGEALQHVACGLEQLPRLFPGGMLVRYITGRGRHSENGAQVKPAVVELLRRRGASFVEGPGYVDVTLGGDDDG